MELLKKLRGLLLLAPLLLLSGCDMVLLNASGDVAVQQSAKFFEEFHAGKSASSAQRPDNLVLLRPFGEWTFCPMADTGAW